MGGAVIARRLHQLPQVPGRGHQAQPQEDQGLCRSLADAGDGARTGDRLRQGVEDRPSRHGDSIGLALGSQASSVEKAFNVTLTDNKALLKGVVSRKSQIVPPLTETLSAQ